jgi:hypothetical protein
MYKKKRLGLSILMHQYKISSENTINNLIKCFEVTVPYVTDVTITYLIQSESDTTLLT